MAENVLHQDDTVYMWPGGPVHKQIKSLIIISDNHIIIIIITDELQSIKTHDSESRGQEETAIIRETKNTRPLSELFTRKSVKKLTNTLVKPP